MSEDLKVVSLITVILAGSLFAVLVADDVLRVEVRQPVSGAAGECPRVYVPIPSYYNESSNEWEPISEDLAYMSYSTAVNRCVGAGGGGCVAAGANGTCVPRLAFVNDSTASEGGDPLAHYDCRCKVTSSGMVIYPSNYQKQMEEEAEDEAFIEELIRLSKEGEELP